MKYLFGLSAVAILLFAACSKNKDVPVDPDAAKLLGNWDWVATDHGWATRTSPQTEGYSETLKFLSAGNYILLRNDKLYGSGIYRKDSAGIVGYSIVFDNNLWALSFSDSTITFGDGFADGTQYYYRKRK